MSFSTNTPSDFQYFAIEMGKDEKKTTDKRRKSLRQTRCDRVNIVVNVSKKKLYKIAQ